MQKNNSLEQRIYLHYYQFVQFLNQYQFTQMIAMILVWSPNIIVFFDLLANISDTSEMMGQIVYLNFTLILNELISQNMVIVYVLQILFLILSIIPLLILVLMIVMSLKYKEEQDQMQRNLASKFEQSALFKIIRIYFKTYKEIIFPIILSFTIKIMKIQASILISGIFIIILLFTSLFMSIYYDLQIFMDSQNYKSCNFKGVITSFTVIGITIILLNLVNGSVALIVTLALYLIALLFSLYVPSFNKIYEIHQKLSVILIIGSSFCLLLIDLTYEQNVMILYWLVLVSILMILKKIFISPSEQNQQDKQQRLLLDDDNEQLNLQELKQQLWKKQKFIQTFQGLIRLSRQKNSHRQQLMIQILKSKCHKKQIISSGGSKITNPIDLFTYQRRITNSTQILLQLIKTSLQIFTIMKQKQTFQDVFIERVVINKKLLQKFKKQLEKALQINSNEPKSMFLLYFLCKNLQNDGDYLKEKYQKFKDQLFSQLQLKSRKKLFSDSVALIVINIMEEIGKITRMTNNITTLLGYKPYHLVNLPINSLMPFTIREIHDEVLTRFIQNFDCKTQRKNPKIYSYAYNKDFQLKKVSVEYKFMMKDFQTLSLSGILQQLQVQETIIFTDSKGNIEGWNRQAGQFLKLDQIAGPDCRNYNLMPLLPALIKYHQKQLCCRTLLFLPSHIKNPKLAVVSAMKCWQNIHEKQVQAFKSMVLEQQVVDIYLVDVEVKIKKYLDGKAQNYIIQIKRFKQVENIEQIMGKLLSKQNQKSSQNQQMLVKQKIATEDSAQFSVINQNKTMKNAIDLNFSNDINKSPKIRAQDVSIRKDFINNLTFMSNKSLFKPVSHSHNITGIQLNEKQIGVNTHIKPKIKREIKGFNLVIIATIFFVGILFYDQISLINVYRDLDENTYELKKLSRIQMILAKSTFNSNQTYIDEFRSGSLVLKTTQNLQNNKFDFQSQRNQPKISYTYFYLLNIQIPSVLDSLVSIEDSNRHQFFQYQLYGNFYNLVELFDRVEIDKYQNIKQSIEISKTLTIVISVIIGIGAVILSTYLLYIRYEQSIQAKTIQGFFKFEKSDINNIIAKISDLNLHLLNKIVQWNITSKIQNFGQDKIAEDSKIENKKRTFYKAQQPSYNMESKNSKSKQGSYPSGLKNPIKDIFKLSEDKIQGNRKKLNIDKNKSYIGIIGVVSFIVLQVAFLLTFGIANTHILDQIVQIYQDIMFANKLFILPSLYISSLYANTPTNIIQKYQIQVQKILDFDQSRLPELYQLLQNPPCEDCNYLSEVLETNYKSFYSYFNKALQARIANNNKQDIQQLIYAADLVSDNVFKAIKVPELPLIIFIIIIYLTSLAIFYITLLKTMKQITDHTENLETVLKYFDNEIINKNKHLNAIFDKNQ